MRSPAENREYMSNYMKNKYNEDIENSRIKSLNNYYNNKYSVHNQTTKINNILNKLQIEILNMIENNENIEPNLKSITNDLMFIVNSIKSNKLPNTKFTRPQDCLRNTENKINNKIPNTKNNNEIPNTKNNNELTNLLFNFV